MSNSRAETEEPVAYPLMTNSAFVGADRRFSQTFSLLMSKQVGWAEIMKANSIKNLYRTRDGGRSWQVALRLMPTE